MSDDFEPTGPAGEKETPAQPRAGGEATPSTGFESHARQLSAVYDVPVTVTAVLGKAVMPIGQLLRLGRGAVVELDRKVGEPVDIYVNNRLVARGEVLLVDDHLGITMTEIVKSET